MMNEVSRYREISEDVKYFLYDLCHSPLYKHLKNPDQNPVSFSQSTLYPFGLLQGAISRNSITASIYLNGKKINYSSIIHSNLKG